MVNPKTRPARHVNEEKLHEIFHFEHKILEYTILFNIQNSTFKSFAKPINFKIAWNSFAMHANCQP